MTTPPPHHSLSLEEAVETYAKSATAAFSTEEAMPAILSMTNEPPADPRLALDNLLEMSYSLFPDFETETHIPRRIFFEGAQFLIVPTPEEIAEGILVPGHRFIPFHARDVFPGDCQLSIADAAPIPLRQIEKPLSEFLIYLSLFGGRGAVEYVMREGEVNQPALEAGPGPDRPVTLTVFDMTDIYARYHVTTGDAFLCTVNDWSKGHYALEYIPAGSRASRESVQAWVAAFEWALSEADEFLGRQEDIYEQVAAALYVSDEVLNQHPPLHVGGFLAETSEYRILSMPFGATLAAPGMTAEELLSTEPGPSPLRQISGRCDSLDAILDDIGLTTTAAEIEACMRDELSRRGDSLSNVLAHVLAGRPDLTFYDQRQDDLFHRYLNDLWDDTRSKFDPEMDRRVAPLRTRILKLMDGHTAWLRECDRRNVPIQSIPQAEYAELGHLSGIFAGALQVLNLDEAQDNGDLQQIDDMMQQLEAQAMRLLDSLREATAERGSGHPHLRILPQPNPEPESIYQLKVTLKGIRPPIWRRLLVASDTSLDELHEIIQIAMGWDDCHLHEFGVDGLRFGPNGDPNLLGLDGPEPETFTPLDVITNGPGSKFSYTYDFGDGWEHTILIEKELPLTPESSYPRCIKGKRACPPEDCGGTWGYQHLLEVLSDPSHPDYGDLIHGVPSDLAPETLDLMVTNTRLATFAAARAPGP